MELGKKSDDNRSTTVIIKSTDHYFPSLKLREIRLLVTFETIPDIFEKVIVEYIFRFNVSFNRWSITP